jgi:hypothetical protein
MCEKRSCKRFAEFASSMAYSEALSTADMITCSLWILAGVHLVLLSDQLPSSSLVFHAPTERLERNELVPSTSRSAVPTLLFPSGGWSDENQECTSATVHS